MTGTANGDSVEVRDLNALALLNSCGSMRLLPRFTAAALDAPGLAVRRGGPRAKQGAPQVQQPLHPHQHRAVGPHLRTPRAGPTATRRVSRGPARHATGSSQEGPPGGHTHLAAHVLRQHPGRQVHLHHHLRARPPPLAAWLPRGVPPFARGIPLDCGWAGLPLSAHLVPVLRQAVRGAAAAPAGRHEPGAIRVSLKQAPPGLLGAGRESRGGQRRVGLRQHQHHEAVVS